MLIPVLRKKQIYSIIFLKNYGTHLKSSIILLISQVYITYEKRSAITTGDQELLEIFRSLIFRNCFRGEIFPMDWKKSKVLSIHLKIQINYR